MNVDFDTVSQCIGDKTVPMRAVLHLGDGVVASFQDADDALSAAVTVQTALDREAWPATTPIPRPPSPAPGRPHRTQARHR